MRVAGVDGTKGGWVAVVLEDGHFVRAYVLRPVTTDFGELSDAGIVAVDIPIGFGPRAADQAARDYLKGAAAVVFSVPSQADLEKGPGPGVTAQVYALRDRIDHVTELAGRDPRFREVHSEVSFRAMNGGRPLRYRKRSAGGAFERIGLLRRHGIELGDLDAAAAVPLDDVLDAAAAAWSAQRIATGTAKSLPDPPQDGIAIWY